MTQINIHEAKTHLFRYAKRVKAGETIILSDRNIPFAEIRPLPRSEVLKSVKFGVCRGEFEVGDDFNATLESFENEFYGTEKE